MAAVFSEQRAVADWLVVEAALTHGLAAAGVVEGDTAERIIAACRPEVVDTEGLWSQSATVGYPIFPLVRMICASLDDEAAGFVHFGATTQDIMDCALALQLRDAAGRLLDLVGQLGDGLAVLVRRHEGTLMAGRTHAQQAVPTTFGAKCAVFLDEFTRHRERLTVARQRVSVLSLFGAGGTSAALGERAAVVRDEMARRLDLAATEVPWHVARDRVAEFAMAAALVTATCVRLAREMVDLSRTEIGEVAEADGLYRGASSTMPQKANPISAELTIGFGVMAQAAASAMLRAMEAGHERAAGEWQVEWQALPAASASAAGALRAAIALTSGLRVFPGRMRANLDADGGRIMAEGYMIALASQLGRDRAHEVLYEAVRRSREKDQPLVATLRSSLDAEAWSALEPVLPTPSDYLGSTTQICQAAVTEWRRGAQPDSTRTDPVVITEEEGNE
ncbi:adenylosuccinate lyase family protein [Streptomyces sp. NBC_00353]